MVLVENTSGKLRICLKPNDHNKAAQRLSFFFDTATPPCEAYVQVDRVFKPRYKKCMGKEQDKDDSVNGLYKQNLKAG